MKGNTRVPCRKSVPPLTAAHQSQQRGSGSKQEHTALTTFIQQHSQGFARSGGRGYQPSASLPFQRAHYYTYALIASCWIQTTVLYCVHSTAYCSNPNSVARRQVSGTWFSPTVQEAFDSGQSSRPGQCTARVMRYLAYANGSGSACQGKRVHWLLL